MRKTFSWGLLALIAATQARATDVTEEVFLAALNEGHAAVRTLGAGLAAAEAARRRAGILANPRIEFWREQPDAAARVTNWTISWTPPLDGRYSLGKTAADARVAAAREELVLDRVSLRLEMRRVFAEWSVEHERGALLSLQLEHIDRLAEQERQRARAGSESGLAARRLALAAAKARAELREAQASRDGGEARARAWQPDLPDAVSPRVPTLPVPPENLESVTSPKVRSVEHRLEQARLEERLARRFWGFPTLQAGVQRVEEGGFVQTGPIFAASWSIPLFDRSQAGRAQAQRRVEIAEAGLEQTGALIRGEVQAGLSAYRALFMAAGEAHEASAETDRVIEGATAAYRAGETSLTDLLDALGAAFDARLRALELRGLALGAHRKLEAAVGRPLTEGGVQ